MLGQMHTAILLLTRLDIFGYSRFPLGESAESCVLAISIALFISSVIVGLKALSLVSIRMFSAFPRLTLLFAMAAEHFFLDKAHSCPIIQTVVVITTGAFVSGIDDISFSLLRYCLVFLNSVLAAAYHPFIKRATKDTRPGPVALL